MISYLFSSPLTFFLFLIALLVAIDIHEFSHAAVADFLGDPTPRLQGRLTLNPLVHIDNIGIIFLLLVGFGWGKPVEFDPYNLKNPRTDAAWISIAGPISNILLALILSLLLRLFMFLQLNLLTTIGGLIFLPIIQMNIVLGIFNIIPIHPLDGFKIVGGLLSHDQAKEWYGMQKYGIFLLLLLIIPFGGSSLLDFIIRPPINFLFKLLIPFSTGGII